MPTELAAELAELGWRTEVVRHPDDTTTTAYVPLTSAEFLHPEEAYHLPNSTFHDNVSGDAKDMLTRRYASDPTIAVFRDLLIIWNISELAPHCPDVYVRGIRNKQQNRSRFVVEDEGVRPAFVIEVVSPRYRKEEKGTKVEQYERAHIQEYVIVDRRTQRGQVLEEVLGYRLVAGRYRPLTPDDDGRILCKTVGLWISLREGNIVMEDVQTGERLRTSGELEAENEDLRARLAALPPYKPNLKGKEHRKQSNCQDTPHKALLLAL
jgi:Uma2 family endonuclease